MSGIFTVNTISMRRRSSGQNGELYWYTAHALAGTHRSSSSCLRATSPSLTQPPNRENQARRRGVLTRKSDGSVPVRRNPSRTLKHIVDAPPE